MKIMELGSIALPLDAGLGYSESFETFGGFATLRLGAGAAVKQTAWEKLRVTLSGEGWVPHGLQALNYSAPLTLKCGTPRAITSSTPSATLPAGRRTDAGYTPFAFAHTARGRVATPVSVAAHTATVTPVAGATAYSVMYYPQLSVIATPPADETRTEDAATSWQIVCEEV